MIIHEHRRKDFPILEPRFISGFGWAVVGTKTPKAKKSFAVVANERSGFGFDSEQEALDAITEIKGRPRDQQA